MVTQKFIELTGPDTWEKTLEDVCVHVANGGSIIDLCKLWCIRWGDLNWWLNIDKDRQKKYIEALTAQTEWSIQRILTELRSIAYCDMSGAFDSDHSLKPLEDWPEELRRRIAGIEVDEIKEDGIKIGVTKKVKLVDKIKAIELMMKNLNMLTERTMNLHGTTDDKEFRDEFFGIKK
jgi:hypothetical protein